MERLFEEAMRIHEKDPDLADRYAELAWRIKLKHRVDLPPRWKGSVCRKCHSFMVPGSSSRVRVRRGMVVTRCLRCGDTRRYVID